MKIEIITVGDEVLSGTITDTNAAWLGDVLWSRGYDLHRHVTVGDEDPQIAAALLEAAGRSRAVIVTGGLGPTVDDITVASAAAAFGIPLEPHEPSVERMRELFRRMNREMSDTNLKQALLPVGSDVLPNAVGTAPGCRVEFRGTAFHFLPGVPREMKRMFEDHVLPWLEAQRPVPMLFEARVLRSFGMAEATVQERLLDCPLDGVDLAFRPSFPDLILKVSARGLAGDRVRERVEAAAAWIASRLGDHVYGQGDAILPEVVGARVHARGETLAVAEAGTGGRLADQLTDLADSDTFFRGGIIAASPEALGEALGLPQDGTTAGDALRAEAEAAAAAVRVARGATWGLAVVGWPGPAGLTRGQPGTVAIALAGPDGPVGVAEQRFPRGRDWFKRIASWSALEMLRRALKTLDA